MEKKNFHKQPLALCCHKKLFFLENEHSVISVAILCSFIIYTSKRVNWNRIDDNPEVEKSLEEFNNSRKLDPYHGWNHLKELS